MKVLYFASMRDLTQDDIQIDQHQTTVKSLKHAIGEKHRQTKALLEICMIAVDGEYQNDLKAVIM